MFHYHSELRAVASFAEKVSLNTTPRMHCGLSEERERERIKFQSFTAPSEPLLQSLNILNWRI